MMAPPCERFPEASFGVVRPLQGPYVFFRFPWVHPHYSRFAPSAQKQTAGFLAERYYIRVTETHVTAGFERFLAYLDQRLAHSPQAVARNVS
jgi:hypothetical protein